MRAQSDREPLLPMNSCRYVILVMVVALASPPEGRCREKRAAAPPSRVVRALRLVAHPEMLPWTTTLPEASRRLKEQKFGRCAYIEPRPASKVGRPARCVIGKVVSLQLEFADSSSDLGIVRARVPLGTGRECNGLANDLAQAGYEKGSREPNDKPRRETYSRYVSLEPGKQQVLVTFWNRCHEKSPAWTITLWGQDDLD
jgi:hypothetical protein